MIVTKKSDQTILRQYAKSLRINSTNTERHLWYYLRAKRLGFKFKRQFLIGRYIVDFVCLEKHIIIEFDSGQHLDNESYDKERTAWLIKVFRFWNSEVLQQTQSVLEVILGTLTEVKI